MKTAVVYLRLMESMSSALSFSSNLSSFHHCTARWQSPAIDASEIAPKLQELPPTYLGFLYPSSPVSIYWFKRVAILHAMPKLLTFNTA